MARRPDPALLNQVSQTLVAQADVRAAASALVLDDEGRSLVARIVDSAICDFPSPDAGVAALAWLVASYATCTAEQAAEARPEGKTLVYLWPRVPLNRRVESDPGQLTLDLDGRLFA
jgi:hypothetical protein